MGHCAICNSGLDDYEIDICNACREDNEFPSTTDSIESAIDELEDHPLTELQQSLMNYLRANIDDVAEALEEY